MDNLHNNIPTMLTIKETAQRTKLPVHFVRKLCSFKVRRNAELVRLEGNMAIYGYCRVSTHTQRIERQESNILEKYPQAVIFKEAFSGTKLQGRKELDKILRRVNPGDTIVFDEVSRMSRNAEEGFALYQELFYKNINLVFLKEPHINTTTYRDSLNNGLALTGNDIADIYINATNRVLMILAEKQIRYAFEQAQKEVDYLHTRTKEGMMRAKEAGHIAGRRTGSRVETRKAISAKETIRKHNKSFGGSLSNEETWRLAGISKISFYKYKKEILDGCDSGKIHN